MSDCCAGPLCFTVSSLEGQRTYGVPTVRTDLPAPRLRRMGDTNNYGEQAGAAHLLHPSLLSLWGVHEEHLFRPRSKQEVLFPRWA